MNATPDIRSLLANALASSNAIDAELVRRDSTRIVEYPAPFLRTFKIFRIEPQNPYKPVPFYVGFAPKRDTFLLTGSPGAYISLAHADGVSIDSEQTAVRYVTAYFEVTRSMSVLSYLITSVDEVRFRPGLTGAAATTRDMFLEKYQSVIMPPAVTRRGADYVMTVYRVHEQTVERHAVGVTIAGDLADDMTVVERDLPLVYGA